MGTGLLPLAPDKALVFRISHVDNVPWALANGLRCRSSQIADPNYRNIGIVDLIQKRASRSVPIAPGGTLSDYVPFYFTSRSPMLFNIKTGRNVGLLPMNDIVVFVASLHTLNDRGIPFVFTDRHAYLVAARFSSDLDDLDRIDWDILQRSDFKYDANDIGKMDRYQAEALIHDCLPIDGLSAIICYSDTRRAEVSRLVEAAGHSTKVIANSRYFF